jgi:DNA mismatch endonuclease (patch repair protein)
LYLNFWKGGAWYLVDYELVSMDRLTPERRSWNMSRIRGLDTTPEKRVRSLLHRRGFRYSLHRKDLPGKPDIVLTRFNTVIFVHGCFWHHHAGCSNATLPKTRSDFWATKLAGNVERDARNAHQLKQLGWNVLIVWECELDDEIKLQKRLCESLAHAK